MLLKDEQYVVRWLSQYGPLPKTQVIRLLKDKSPQTANKIIKNLKRQMEITDVGGYYLSIDSMCKPDQRMILALWVLISFQEHVEPMEHYPATFPSQIFFLMNNVGYEIVVLYEGDQNLVRLLQPQEDLKYIIVVPDISMVRTLALPTAPCLFVTVAFNESDAPEITFYSEEVLQSESCI